ncbi:MAG: hypothetical protein EOO88_53410 [Pedobacter sp.]|nr:MAG: hypothetical protein EOO88_53410 [Pedobacter sp.]
MKHVLALFSMVLILSCSKSDTILSANELVGTWRLITYCKPTSDSTCTSVTVPSDKGVFISFDNTGRFNEFYENTKPVDYSFLGCGGGSYELEGGNLRIRAVCMSSLSGRLVKLVSTSGNRLTLNPFGPGDYVFVMK